MVWNEPGTLIRAVCILAATWVFYDRVMTVTGNLCAPAARRFIAGRAIAAQYSPADLDAICRLTISALLQTAFIVILVPATGVDLWSLVARHFDPLLIIYGSLLGIAEMAFASMLCYAAIRPRTAMSTRAEQREVESLLALMRAGWMRLFLRTAESAPLPFILLITVLYVAGEELVFRGVLMTFLGPFGAAVQLTLPLVIFLAAQTFRMPSLESALFPLVGALVMGVTHGALLLTVPNIVPLILAHLTFFAFALL
jgi:membrane protease YdiL (CAAX protease family)